MMDNFNPGPELRKQLATIPLAELQQDKADALREIGYCNAVLLMYGDFRLSNGMLVSDIKASNEEQSEVISRELERRAVGPEGEDQ